MRGRLSSLVQGIFRRGAFEDEMDAEMRFHIDQRTADLIRHGVPAAEAARRARLAFGSIEKQKDESRASFGLRLFDDLRGDLRVAGRRIVASPLRALLILATIAIGIGASTAVFSVVDQTVLRPPPFLFADRLVDVLDANRKTGGGGEPDPRENPRLEVAAGSVRAARGVRAAAD